MRLCGEKPAGAIAWRAVQQLRGVGLALMLALLIAPRTALAHAHLVKSSPAAGERLIHSPDRLQLWFSEAAEPTLTTLVLTGSDGRKVTVSPARVDAKDPLLLVADLRGALAAGEYTLEWRTVAKDDGHPSEGHFSFRIDGSAVAAIAMSHDTTAASTDSTQRVLPTPARVMDLESPSYVIARWLNFTAIVCMIGVVAFRTLVLPAVKRQGKPETSQAAFQTLATRRAASLGAIAGVAALLGTVCRLYAEQAVIGAGVGMMTILNTFWGRIWILQFALALVACLAFAFARPVRSARSVSGRAPAWVAASAAAVLMGAVPAFSGHAIATTHFRTFSVTLDIVHVIAAGGWLGGLIAVALVGLPAAVASAAQTAAATTSDNSPRDNVSLVAAMVNAFSPTALTFATLVVLTGATAAWLRVGSFEELFHSPYGTILLIKLAFVALVLAGGAFNWLRMRGALSHGDARQAVVGKFRSSAWLELSAGALVIVATAILVAAQPPVR